MNDWLQFYTASKYQYHDLLIDKYAFKEGTKSSMQEIIGIMSAKQFLDEEKDILDESNTCIVLKWFWMLSHPFFFLWQLF